METSQTVTNLVTSCGICNEGITIIGFMYARRLKPGTFLSRTVRIKITLPAKSRSKQTVDWMESASSDSSETYNENEAMQLHNEYYIKVINLDKCLSLVNWHLYQFIYNCLVLGVEENSVAETNIFRRILV